MSHINPITEVIYVQLNVIAEEKKALMKRISELDAMSSCATQMLQLALSATQVPTDSGADETKPGGECPCGSLDSNDWRHIRSSVHKDYVNKRNK